MDTGFWIKKAEIYTVQKKIASFNKWCWSNRMAACRKIQVDPHTYHLINSIPNRSKTSP